MNKSFYIFIIVMICLAGQQTAAAETADFYVAVDGSDSNPGSKIKPFASWSRAQEAVRERVADGLQADILVLVRGGEYRLEKPLVFEPQDAGDETHKVIYAAYPGERVLVSGGQKLTWHSHKIVNGMWQMTIEEVKSGKLWFRQLWKNNMRLPRGRWPNDHMLRVTEVSDDYKTIKLDKNFPVKDLGNQDAELVAIHDWSIARAIIASSQGKTLRTVTAPGWIGHQWTTVGVGRPAYLEHALAFVDKPGEWYLDRKQGVLNYQPFPGEKPGEVEFMIGKLARLVEIQGSLERPVRNLHFQGIEFVYANWALPEIGYSGIQACYYGTRYETEPSYPVAVTISLSYAWDCGFTECRLRHLGASGLGMKAGCRRNRVSGCEIDDIGSNGVMVGMRGKANHPGENFWQTDWENALDVPLDNEVSNCYVHGCGVENFGASGIWVAFSKGTRIAHNAVTDMPYSGISVGFQWDTVPHSQSECLVEYNHVYDTMKMLADASGIYTLGCQPGTVLRGNLIHDVRRSDFAHGSPNNGFFFDQGSKGFLIEGNIIYNIADEIYRFNLCKKQWHTWRNNSFGITPNQPGFPELAAARAGLEPPYRYLLRGPSTD